jgi:hypothetical protein
MPNMRSQRSSIVTLGLILAVSLFSAAVISIGVSYSPVVFAQTYGSPFKGNVTGAIVSEQGSDNARANMSSSASYKSSYPSEKADERRPFTVHSENHLYKPGDDVIVEGLILASLIDQIGGDVGAVTLNVTDNKGNVTAEEDAELDDNGEFSVTFSLPDDAELGSYSIDAMIEVEASILDTLDASIKSKLETSARFAVVSSNAFAVNAEGKNFDVEIASNSTVSAFEFKQQEKKVAFRVEGETGTRGVTQITIPKALLSGEMMVSIDGNVIPPESSDVVAIVDTEEGMTLEINYHHSEHTVEVSGTNVVPEFPVSMIIMAAAIGSVIATVSIASRRKGFTY